MKCILHISSGNMIKLSNDITNSFDIDEYIKLRSNFGYYTLVSISTFIEELVKLLNENPVINYRFIEMNNLSTPLTVEEFELVDR